MMHRQLWEGSLEMARECLAHPFVRGLADGSLPEQPFRHYVAQDRFFLNVFLQAYALAGARAGSPEAAAVFVELQAGVLEEMKMHAGYAARLEIDLDSVRAYRATMAYCDFLLRCAYHESIGVAVAAMTPCMRLYRYLGNELARDGVPEHTYADWIRTYDGEGFGRLVDRIESLLDSLAADTAEVRDAYRYALQCEIDFFTAALEGGP